MIWCIEGRDGMVNSVNPDQTAPMGAVWSGFTLFDQTCPIINGNMVIQPALYM